MKKQKCGCCCDAEIRAYFCPRCKSKKVGFIQGWRNAFGIIPRMRCNECGFENMTFPIIVIHGKLNKKNKRRKK
ncbi:MAG: hypothetical protein KKB21_02375 [Nanoarchaeota archaeon]|nr:hypothetical protein [Nanoarchaeota archaeon]MBU4086402.1 hypothetical protein [Nanoarchaeota archaeon]